MFRHIVRIAGIGFTIACLVSGCTLLHNIKNIGNGKSNKELAEQNLELGVRYMDIGMLDVAKEKLETALSQDSSNPDVHNVLGAFYERLNQPDKAEDNYKTALRLAPDNFSYQNNYGRFLCEHKEIDQGMSMLKEALASPMNDRNWFALSNIGKCYELQGQFDKSEDYFRQALLNQPSYPAALLEMAKISYKKQQYMSARAFMQRYQSVAPQTAETLWYAYQTERAMGDQQNADDYRTLLLNQFPASEEAQQVKHGVNK
jgi:type IV pilus assembly protein PilF